jgi:rhodanese-related sulfurtransferase
MRENAKKRREAAFAPHALVLTAALLAFAAAPAGFGIAFAGEIPEVRTLSVDEGHALVEENRDNPDFVILDVRMESEFRAGHLENALNLDYYSESFKEDLGGLDKTKTYFVYCRSGNRSERAVEVMGGLGFADTYNLGGGYAQWMKMGYPVAQ